MPIDEAQAIDGEAVLHVFSVKLAATERQRRRHDRAIPLGATAVIICGREARRERGDLQP
jgi:hypothetical protein